MTICYYYKNRDYAEQGQNAERDVSMRRPFWKFLLLRT